MSDERVSRDGAVEIAMREVGWRPVAEDSCSGSSYGFQVSEEVWFVRFPDPESCFGNVFKLDGSSYYVCVSKRSGKVLYRGFFFEGG